MPITRALLESWSRPSAKPHARPRPAHAAPGAEGERTNASAARHGLSGLQRSSRRGGGGGTDGGGGGGGGDRRGGGVHGWRSFRLDKFSVVGSNSPRNQVPPTLLRPYP